MLKRKTALIVLSMVLALAFIAIVSLAVLVDSPSNDLFATEPDTSASAAITAASSFGKLNNGAKYYYSSTTAGAADIAVTVKSTDTYGSQTNPYVIETKEQWVLFANVITEQRSGYTGSAKFWVLNADIDLNGNAINSVGRHATGFQGTLFGNRHSIKNGTVNYWQDGANYYCGLFYQLNGAKIYDLEILSSLKLTMKAGINSSSANIFVGSLAAFSTNNVMVVNVESYVSLTNVQSGTTYTPACFGGIIGDMRKGGSVYKCIYNGTFDYTIGATASSAFLNGETITMGGITGGTRGYGDAGNYVIDQCTVSGNLICRNFGASIGGISGLPAWNNPSEYSVKITNCVISNLNVKMLGSASTIHTGDIGLISGEDYWQANINLTISNIYIINSKAYRGDSDTTGSIILVGMENNCPTAKINSTTSNLYIPVTSTEAIYPSLLNDATVNKKVGSTSAVVTEANKNSAITSNFSVASSGAVSPKNTGASAHLAFVLGADASNGPADRTYNFNANSFNVTGLSVPKRTGFTFQGWSLSSHNGSVSGTTSSLTVPAGTRGNINAYAVWTPSAFTGAASGATITYGANATLSAGTVAHPAGTKVTLTYQWKNASGTAISGATGSSYTITKPNYTAGTKYILTVTATPTDGVTKAYSQNFEVTLKVNKQGVATPTVATNLIFNNSDQVGITASNSNVTLGGTTHATNAGTYSATASLPSTNYCWGNSGGTDSDTKTYSWSIGKATVAMPTITAGKTVTYNAALQQPTTTTNPSLYTVTNAGGTNVGKYKVSFALVSKTNYKWATAPSAGESEPYEIEWEIIKANVTATAPSFVSNGALAGVYVGQTLADLTITQTTGTHVRAGTSVTVDGQYSWADAGSTRIVRPADGSTTITHNVKFTPTDTANYNVTENIAVTITPKQLYINVQEVSILYIGSDGNEVLYDGNKLDGYLEGLSPASPADLLAAVRRVTSIRRVTTTDVVEIPVDYNKTFNLEALNATSIKSTVDDRDTIALSWQNPFGYKIDFFSAVDGANNGLGKYETAITPAITADLNVYLGYTGKQVEYTVVTVREDLNGHTPTNAEIIAALDSATGITDNWQWRSAVTVTKMQAAAGSRVSYPSQTITGFARVNSLPADGSRTFLSDDQAKFVLGSGKTVLITYYQRNSYTITWVFSGAKWTTAPSDGSAGKSVSNRWSYRLKYGAEILHSDEDPVYTTLGYEFEGWYRDSALTQPVNINETMTVSGNVSFYAGRSSITYHLTFDMGIYEILKPGSNETVTVPDKYMVNLRQPDERDYTVEEIVNKGIISLDSLSMPGFRFLGWVYYDADDLSREHPHKLSNITRTTAGNYDLIGTWELIEYTVALDTQNNVQCNPSQVAITNLMEVNPRIAVPNNWDFANGFAAEGASSLVAEDFIVPTRPGYTFRYWAFRGEDGQEYPAILGSTYDTLLHGQTLYAVWKSNPVRIRYADGVDSTKFSITIKSSTHPQGPDATFVPQNTINNDYLFKDSVLTINVTPANGYEINYIDISGSGFSNGGMYTVRTYENDTIYLNIQLIERRFNITYVWDGGSFIGDDTTRTYPRTFVLSDNALPLVGGKLVSKVGYKFAGWQYRGEIVGNPANDISPYNAYNLGANNVILYAQWTPAPVTMVYHNNYIGANGKEEIYTDLQLNDAYGTQIATGNRIALWQPNTNDTGDEGERFIPANYELVGWSTQPDLDIAYTVTYKAESIGNGEFEFVPQDTYHYVEAQADNVNHLYAKWRIANVQYLTFDAENNNEMFSTDAGYTGVNLTARPRYTYDKDESGNLKLEFFWYKVNPETWTKWTEDDLVGLTEGSDEYNLVQSNILMGIYKIPADATPFRRTDLKDTTPENQMDSSTFKTVKESGLYLCRLDATGRYFSSSGGFKSSTISMYGQYEVIINKANLDKITLTTATNTAVYNGEQQRGLEITWPASMTVGASDGVNVRTLPDGSKIKAVYTFIYNDNEGNDVEVKDSVKNVGSYRVVVSFEFVNDSGNYNLPDSLNGEFTVTRLEISEVTYELQTIVDGVWKKVDSFTGNVYNGQPYRIVAIPTNLKDCDKEIVVISMYYDGQDDHTSAPVNVGEYAAYCDALTGTDAGDGSANYVLSTSLPRQDFSIIKADHKVEVTFKGSTVVYDGQEHKLAIESIIENARRNAEGVLLDGKQITITPVDDETDTILLDDGCTITLRYSNVRQYVDGRMDLDTTLPTSNRGGIHAGTYTVTVKFEDTAANKLNYNQLPDVTATLTVNQAPYSGDGVKAGLSDEQLNRYVTNVESGAKEPNLEGFGDNHSVGYLGDKAIYNPRLVLDSNLFDVTYVRTYKERDDVEFEALDKVKKSDGSLKFNIDEATGLPQYTVDGQTQRGLRDWGTYRITATIKYKDVKYANDYLSLSDYAVELKILPGTIEKIVVDYDQAEHESLLRSDYGADYKGITYGDTFDFLQMGETSYIVGITVEYKATDGGANPTEKVDNVNAKFLNESNDAFIRFDRATIKNDDIANPVAASESGSVDYKISVSVYGATGTMTVKVRQAELSYDEIGFDAENDENIHKNGSNWTFGFMYDGETRYPALSSSVTNSAYNFVGIENDPLKAGTDIVAKYEYTKVDVSNPSVVDWKDMPASGLADAGVYDVRVTFTNNNTNYKAIEGDVATATTLVCRTTITAKLLTANDIIWQYCSDEHFGDNKHTLQPNTNLTYCGTNGYYVRAVYRNLAEKNELSDKYYNIVGEIGLNGTNAPSINIINKGSYSISISNFTTDDGNYVVSGSLTADVTIDPYEIDVNWTPDTLTYNGLDQLARAEDGSIAVKVNYNTPDNFREENSARNNLENDNDIKLSITTFNGEAVGSAFALTNVGVYTIKAELTDKNYVAKNATHELTVKARPIAADAVEWLYKLGDEATEMKDLADAAEGQAYIGANVHVYVKFETAGNDAGDVNEGGTNYRIVEVKDALGQVPYNAGDYEMTGDIAGNYDLTNLTHAFTINKSVATVRWAKDGEDEVHAYTYDGLDHEIKAYAVGVGAEKDTQIIVLSNNIKRNANQGDADVYTTYATVDPNYVGNYVLAGANADGAVEFKWTIAKKEIGVNWSTDNLVYNNGNAITDWGYEVTGRQPEGPEENKDSVTLTYKIYLKTDEGEVEVRNMIVAGEYSIKIVDISDNNYSYANVATHAVTVAKATPSLTNVIYKEYEGADNKTYQGRTLRNEKLAYVAKCGESEVAGTLTFDAPEASATKAAGDTSGYPCTFTPTDTDNYEVVKYNNLSLTVIADNIIRLGLEGAPSMSAVNNTFRPSRVTIYFEYSSYYKETVNNVVVEYGKRELVGDDVEVWCNDKNEDEIDFVKGYTFTSNDVGAQKFTFNAQKPGSSRGVITGEITINVVNAIPTSITVTNKETLEAGKYYVGSTFDKSLAQFIVEFKNSDSSTVDAEYVDADNATMTQTGQWEIVFVYFKGTENEVKTSITVQVSPKEVLKIANPTCIERWTGETIIPKVRLENGDPLPEDVTFTYAGEGGEHVNILDEGEYTVVFKFTAPEYKYETIENITAVITVKRIVAELNPDTLRAPQESRPYNGVALTKDDYMLRGVDIIDNESQGTRYEILETTYTVNGRAIDGYEIRNAGEYRFVASFRVKPIGGGDDAVEFTIDHEYSITITQAKNEITSFAINSWVSGAGSGTITFNSTFGEPMYDFYLLDSATDDIGEFVGNTLPDRIGRYRVEVTVPGSNNYQIVTDETFFEIRKPLITASTDTNGDSLVDDEGNNIVEVTGKTEKDGVNPYYQLNVTKLSSDETSKVAIKNQVVVSGYDINIVDSDKNIVENPGEYTVKLLLTAEQRDSKNYKNLKVYIVDEYGVAIGEVSGAKVNEDGYMVFTTSNFSGNFVVCAQDAAAMAQMGWIIGVSVGGLIALAAIVILIIVVIKKKKERD